MPHSLKGDSCLKGPQNATGTDLVRNEASGGWSDVPLQCNIGMSVAGNRVWGYHARFNPSHRRYRYAEHCF